MSKIINFDEAAKRFGPVETTYTVKRKRSPSECSHHRLQLDDSTRLAECVDCGDALDPYDVLLDYARRERKTKHDTARYEAAVTEFKAIQENWNLTIAEKRRISKAMEQARFQQ